MSGSYQIKCRDSSQVEFVTREISFDESADKVNLYLQLEVPFLQFKVLVRETYAYDYKENGVSLAIVFLDLKQDVPQCEIYSGTDDPIIGSEPINFSSVTLQEYGNNLLFEPIPMEMLYTDVQGPQVKVKVDGLDALCVGFNCEYSYEEA